LLTNNERGLTALSFKNSPAAANFALWHGTAQINHGAIDAFPLTQIAPAAPAGGRMRMILPHALNAASLRPRLLLPPTHKEGVTGLFCQRNFNTM
jgi:hypothetical protein